MFALDWHVILLNIKISRVPHTFIIGEFCFIFNFFAVPVPYEHDRRPKLMRRAQMWLRLQFNTQLAQMNIWLNRNERENSKNWTTKIGHSTKFCCMFCLMNFKTTETTANAACVAGKEICLVNYMLLCVDIIYDFMYSVYCATHTTLTLHFIIIRAKCTWCYFCVSVRLCAHSFWHLQLCADGGAALDTFRVKKA